MGSNDTKYGDGMGFRWLADVLEVQDCRCKRTKDCADANETLLPKLEGLQIGVPSRCWIR